MEVTRENVIAVLEAAGFTPHAPRSRRKRDPAPADGYRVIPDHDGSVLAVWVTNSEWKATPSPGVRAEAARMAGQYIKALRDAGLTAGLAGLGWDYARVHPPLPAARAREEQQPAAHGTPSGQAAPAAPASEPGTAASCPG